VHVRGEGNGGIVDLTTPKTVLTHRQRLVSDGHLLRFTMVQNPNGLPAETNPRGITVRANDVVIEDIEMTSTQDLATNTCYGIALAEGPEDLGHRLTLRRLHIHNWMRPISKDGSASSRWLEDVKIDDCYLHSFNNTVLINFGLIRLHMRNTRILGRIGSETHKTHNAFYGGANWQDCVFENCLFGNVTRIGHEAMCPGYQYTQQRTHMIKCRSENTGSMGFSSGFGEGIIFEKCVAKNVRWIGFELCGKPPEIADPDGSYRYGQGILESCEVDGVTSATETDEQITQTYGMSIDGTRDSIVCGATRISNISASVMYEDCGICVQGSERCSVKDVTFLNAGHLYLYFTHGMSPNTRGFHEAVGNTFRNLPGAPAKRAIHIDNTTVEVRHNTSWQQVGTDLSYTSDTKEPALVTVDGKSVPLGLQPFTGSNLLLPART
jgi:hypothetical protein